MDSDGADVVGVGCVDERPRQHAVLQWFTVIAVAVAVARGVVLHAVRGRRRRRRLPRLRARGWTGECQAAVTVNFMAETQTCRDGGREGERGGDRRHARADRRREQGARLLPAPRGLDGGASTAGRCPGDCVLRAAAPRP